MEYIKRILRAKVNALLNILGKLFDYIIEGQDYVFEYILDGQSYVGEGIYNLFRYITIKIRGKNIK
ncbi:MAG: hypothetical protein LBC92_01630 [Rickettsiales bacterium]|jgi:hypothetical protein|nr:hypothetical protein [Rickettsiales bacterium]